MDKEWKFESRASGEKRMPQPGQLGELCSESVEACQPQLVLEINLKMNVNKKKRRKMNALLCCFPPSSNSFPLDLYFLSIFHRCALPKEKGLVRHTQTHTQLGNDNFSRRGITRANAQQSAQTKSEGKVQTPINSNESRDDLPQIPLLCIVRESHPPLPRRPDVLRMLRENSVRTMEFSPKSHRCFLDLVLGLDSSCLVSLVARNFHLLRDLLQKSELVDSSLWACKSEF